MKKNQPIEKFFHSRLLEEYNKYLIIGGMPECVASWVRYQDPAKISQIQHELFSKHNGSVNTGLLKHMAGLDNSAINSRSL